LRDVVSRCSGQTWVACPAAAAVERRVRHPAHVDADRRESSSQLRRRPNS
jgi:hypothetical protein